MASTSVPIISADSHVTEPPDTYNVACRPNLCFSRTYKGG
jgi:hypothetical protein